MVKQYNQKQQKTPLAGVLVTVGNAGSATSGADGRITLTFRTLKPDRIMGSTRVKTIELNIN
ncbi:MAG: hypothetical protein IJM04_07340 [Prevotella sp.]|nr:hypothetical protein [Prevotella sp.]